MCSRIESLANCACCCHINNTHYLSLITLIQDEFKLVLSHLNSSDYIDIQLHQRINLNAVAVVVAVVAAAADVEQQLNNQIKTDLSFLKSTEPVT